MNRAHLEVNELTKANILCLGFHLFKYYFMFWNHCTICRWDVMVPDGTIPSLSQRLEWGCEIPLDHISSSLSP